MLLLMRLLILLRLILLMLILFNIFKMLGLKSLMWWLMYAGGTSRCTASAGTSCPTFTREGGKAAPLREGIEARTGEDIILTLWRRRFIGTETE